MSRKLLVREEWYPVYELSDGKSFRDDDYVDVPDDKLAEYERIMREFTAMQDYLRGLEK